MRSGKLAVLQERIKRGKIMTSARLSTEALVSCFRRVICKGMKVGKATCVNCARWLFVLPNEAKSGILSMALVSQQERTYKKLDSQEIGRRCRFAYTQIFADKVALLTKNQRSSRFFLRFKRSLRRVLPGRGQPEGSCHAR